MYRLYEVVAGGLRKTGKEFQSIKEADGFRENMIIMSARITGRKYNRYSYYLTRQFVLQEYTDKYKATIVKIYNPINYEI